MVLSKEVRRIGAAMMKEMAEALLAGHGLKQEDIRHFVLHSAGRRVIDQAQKLMGLDESAIAHSRHVLRHFGNMSSATVLFVLDELLRSGRAGARGVGPDDRARAGVRRGGRAAPLVAMALWTRLPRAEGAVEMLDGPVPLTDLRECLSDVARLNALFGGRFLTLVHVKRLAARLPRRAARSPCSTWARAAVTCRARSCAGRAGSAGRFASSPSTATRRPRAWRAAWGARYPEIVVLQGDAVDLPVRSGSVDVAISSLTLHHLDEAAAVRHLAEMDRAARRGIVVNDLARSRTAYALVWLRDAPLREEPDVAPRRPDVRAARVRARGAARALREGRALRRAHRPLPAAPAAVRGARQAVGRARSDHRARAVPRFLAGAAGRSEAAGAALSAGYSDWSSGTLASMSGRPMWSRIHLPSHHSTGVTEIPWIRTSKCR